MRVPRRRVLQAASTASLAALAGCSTEIDVTDDGEGNESTGDGDPGTGADDAGADDGADEADGNDGSDDTPEDPEATARQFTDHLFAGEYEAVTDLLSSAYAAQVTPAQVERTRLGFEAALGEFDGVEAVDTGLHQGFQRVRLTYGFEDGSADLRVLTTDDAELAGWEYVGEYERPDYVDPDAFAERELAIDAEGCQLGATLTVPEGDDPAPGVVLVHGTGPVDRDAQTGANAPFRDLAEGLASRGVAVLRYDKRTAVCAVDEADHTAEHVVLDDALLALDELRGAEGVAADRVAVVGHSLGGMLAPEIARRDGDVAGVVGLAAPARPLEDVFLDQAEHLAEVGELTMEYATERLDQWQTAAQQVREGNYEPDEVLLNLPGALWSSLAEYDPVETAGSIDVPQAYHQGGRDYQVTVEDDFAIWRDAFADDPSVHLAEYDRLNHAFMPGHGPQVPEAYYVPNQVAEALVTDLADWTTGEL